jgi:hypothetical protein
MRTATRAKWLTCQVTSYPHRRGWTDVAKATVGGGCRSTAGEVQGPQVAQQVQGGGDQGGSVGTTTGSDNGDASEAGLIAWLGSLSATQSTGLGNQSAC